MDRLLGNLLLENCFLLSIRCVFLKYWTVCIFHISGAQKQNLILRLNLCNSILAKGEKNIDVSTGFSGDLHLFNLDQNLAFVSGIIKYFICLCTRHHMVRARIWGERSAPGRCLPRSWLLCSRPCGHMR